MEEVLLPRKMSEKHTKHVKAGYSEPCKISGRSSCKSLLVFTQQRASASTAPVGPPTPACN